jgi:predicted nucleic acid-binding protein
MAGRRRSVVLDSDVLIEVLRGNQIVAASLGHLMQGGATVAITPITVAEIFAGVRPKEEARTRVLLDAFGCLRIDRAVGELAGTLLARFNGSHSVELADATIAACAIMQHASLWTLNRKHYPMRELHFYSAKTG